MNTTQTVPGWNKGSKSSRCNVFSTVWAAMYGCTGSGNMWRYSVGSFGHRRVEYACPHCLAAEQKTSAMNAPELQAFLGATSVTAGVDNYRYQPAKWIDGRPQLVKR